MSAPSFNIVQDLELGLSVAGQILMGIEELNAGQPIKLAPKTIEIPGGYEATVTVSIAKKL